MPPARPLLLEGGVVVTLDPARRVIPDGAVLVVGDRITAVGRRADLAPVSPDADRIDAREHLILPGFIDAHCHPMQYLAKGIADDVSILTWLYERIYPYESHLDAEGVHVAGLGHAVEMVRTGTTCVNEMGSHTVESLAAALDVVGVRGIVSRSTRDVDDPRYPIPAGLKETADQAAARADEVVARWHGACGGRLRAWFSLRNLRNCSTPLVEAVRDRAAKRRVGIHMHMAGFREENDFLQRQWGMHAVARLKHTGLLGPNLFLAHLGWITPEEIEILASHDVKAAHCPSASMLGAYGNVAHGRFPTMVARGMTVALGSDGAASGRFLDMVRVMYLAACAHKDVLVDPEAMGAHTALEMATIRGARALGWDNEIGSLEVGKKADIVLLDMTGPAWHPARDVVRNLVYGADGSSVDMVIIDGRIVVRGGRVTTIDEADVRRRVDAESRRVLARAGITVPHRWPTA